MHPSDPPTSPGVVERKQRGRILIVDDEPLFVQALATILSVDHAVTAHTDARRACEAIERGAQFDVFLCDIHMPGMSGEDVYHRLRHTHPAVAEGIVFMTAGLPTEALRAFVRSMPNVLLQKPPDLAALRMLIRKRIRGA